MTTTPRPSDGINAAVAAVLDGERRAAKLTYDQLAERTGISRRTLLRLLSSVERDMDLNVLAAIADEFGLTPAETVERAEEWQHRQGA